MRERPLVIYTKHMVNILVLFLVITFLFISCGGPTEPEDSEFDMSQTSGFKIKKSGKDKLESHLFPLHVGTQWLYEMVYTEGDTGWHGWEFPFNFTVSVTGTLTVEGETYYIVENYFLPGPSLPEPTLMRKEGNRVYVLINEEEYMLYSFAEEDSLWSVPLYVNPTKLEPRWANRVELTPEVAIVTWDLRNFPGDHPIQGRTESGWADIFNQSLGRVRIVSKSQVYALTVWDLKKIYTGR